MITRFPFRESSIVLLICVHLQSQVKHLMGTCHPLSISVKTIIALHWVLKSEGDVSLRMDFM